MSAGPTTLDDLLRVAQPVGRGDEHMIDVHVGHVRNPWRRPSDPRVIRTMPGVG